MGGPADGLSLSQALDRSSCLYSLWLKSALCDCTLQASDGTVVPAHRVVLAAASGFFRALFTGAWQHYPAAGPAGSTSLPRWALGGVDGASLQLLLHAIYSKRLPLTAEGADEEVAMLLAASNYLEVLPVKDACCQYLRSQLSLDTVAPTLALAAMHDCHELLADAARYFEGHFSQLLKSEEAAASLAALPPDLLRSLLSSDGLNIGSEVDVARAVLLWAAPDPRQRGPLLAELLPAARMPPRQLQAEAARSGLLGGCPPAAAAPPATAGVDGSTPVRPPSPCTPQQQAAAEQWQAGLASGRNELGTAFVLACEQLQASTHAAAAEAAAVAFPPRLSCATGLLMAGGLDDGWRPLRTVELYDPHRNAWAPGPLMPAPCSFAAASLLGGQCYVVEGAAHAPHVLAFDRQQRRWAGCRGLATPRVNMAVAALEGQLYVLGGRAGIGKGAAVLRDVEMFDPATNSWRSVEPMAAPRAALAAAALGGRLYAVGGQDTRSTHSTLECWEPGAGRWVPLAARMQHPRKYLGVAVAAGRLVAVGGMTGARLRLPAAEALDPREGRWAPLPPMSVARSSAGVAALHDCVYVVGGNTGAEVNECCGVVEAYVPAAGRWRTCAPIGQVRSGLCLTPF